jgi:hypothetical protein
MAEKLEMPNSIVTKLIKEGASQSLNSTNKGQQNGVIVSKDVK